MDLLGEGYFGEVSKASLSRKDAAVS
jgi:hypothetical protein